jgi:acyl carrier protein
MTRHEALQLLEQTLEMEPRTLVGNERLRDLPGWDSMSTLAFISLVDKKARTPLSGARVARCKTVAELLELLGIPPAERAA